MALASPGQLRPDEVTVTPSARDPARVRERLARLQGELRRARGTLRVLSEQVAHLREVADDAETRKLVSETPLAEREWREARTDLDRHLALLEEVRAEVEELNRQRDSLLDRLLELKERP